jgi:hypothetical protein
VVLNKAELDVEANVLVGVAGCVVGFGSKDRADLANPFEDPNHDLLVELRALGQEGRVARCQVSISYFLRISIMQTFRPGSAVGRRLFGPVE